MAKDAYGRITDDRKTSTRMDAMRHALVKTFKEKCGETLPEKEVDLVANAMADAIEAGLKAANVKFNTYVDLDH